MSVQSLHYLSPAQQPQKLRGGDILTMGFATTVAVWVVAYVCRMPIVQAPGKITVLLMLAMVFLGGFATGRYTTRGILGGALTGALSGLLNILIVGSVFSDYVKTHNPALVPAAALWVSGSVLANVVIAAIGAAIGRIKRCECAANINWPMMFAIVLCVATLPLITMGGLVTAFRAGLAVPDWPRSYEYNMFLLPLSMMQSPDGSKDGNFYEHAHRLMGSLVGLTSIAVAIYFTLVDRRIFVKAFVWAILTSVVIQGILGGTRVTEKSLTLAVMHGVYGQLIFASMVCLAAIAACRFKSADKPHDAPGASTDFFLSIALVVTLTIQLILGAILRHKEMMLLMHITFATAPILIGLAVALRSWGIYGHLKPLRTAGLWIIALIGLQVVLGLISIAVRQPAGVPQSTASAFITTAHQANGALLLALASLHMTWALRLLKNVPMPPEAEVVEPAQTPQTTST